MLEREEKKKQLRSNVKQSGPNQNLKILDTKIHVHYDVMWNMILYQQWGGRKKEVGILFSFRTFLKMSNLCPNGPHAFTSLWRISSKILRPIFYHNFFNFIEISLIINNSGFLLLFAWRVGVGGTGLVFPMHWSASTLYVF